MKNMKRLLILLCCLSMLTVLAACGSSTDENDSQDDTSLSEQTTTTTKEFVKVTTKAKDEAGTTTGVVGDPTAGGDATGAGNNKNTSTTAKPTTTTKKPQGGGDPAVQPIKVPDNALKAGQTFTGDGFTFTVNSVSQGERDKQKDTMAGIPNSARIYMVDFTYANTGSDSSIKFTVNDIAASDEKGNACGDYPTVENAKDCEKGKTCNAKFRYVISDGSAQYLVLNLKKGGALYWLKLPEYKTAE